MTADPAAQFPLGVSELASGLRSGIHRVIRQQELLNRINVFPVADGDTGTNLCLSLGATLNTLLQPGSHQMGHFLAGLADQLLDNARGNSGAIVAQFFQGLSDSAEDLAEFTAQSLSDAIVTGNRYARDALDVPREGTILSVIDVFARSLHAHVREDPGTSPGASLKRALSATQEALARTEFQLDVLKKAGVVDAGAQGFVTLMEGVTEYLVNGEITEAPDSATTIASAIISDTETPADLTFRYC
ncbi:MAG: DAK2 domain-containing protein, partial [Woeseiaceae bacterium]|nr:DAK2 domain-containing protein [Woeseiaceae bacterium]